MAPKNNKKNSTEHPFKLHYWLTRMHPFVRTYTHLPRSPLAASAKVNQKTNIKNAYFFRLPIFLQVDVGCQKKKKYMQYYYCSQAYVHAGQCIKAAPTQQILPVEPVAASCCMLLKNIPSSSSSLLSTGVCLLTVAEKQVWDWLAGSMAGSMAGGQVQRE